MRRSESAVALLLGAASGLVVGGMIRLATELLLPAAAEFLRNTSGQLLLIEALVLAVSLIVAVVIGWRVGRQFQPDIRALYGIREPPPTKRPFNAPVVLPLGSGILVAGLSAVLLPGPVAAIVAIGVGVTIRLAVVIGIALRQSVTNG